jgi:hypothetical protein
MPDLDSLEYSLTLPSFESYDIDNFFVFIDFESPTKLGSNHSAFLEKINDFKMKLGVLMWLNSYFLWLIHATKTPLSSPSQNRGLF